MPQAYVSLGKTRMGLESDWWLVVRNESFYAGVCSSLPLFERWRGLELMVTPLSPPGVLGAPERQQLTCSPLLVSVHEGSAREHRVSPSVRACRLPCCMGPHVSHVPHTPTPPQACGYSLSLRSGPGLFQVPHFQTVAKPFSLPFSSSPTRNYMGFRSI